MLGIQLKKPMVTTPRSRRHSLLPLLDLGAEAAAVELKRDGVADLDLSGVAQDVASRVGGDSVAALKNF